MWHSVAIFRMYTPIFGPHDAGPSFAPLDYRGIVRGCVGMSEKRTLRLAIPNGSLQEPTVDLFCRAGYNMKVGARSYYPIVADDEIECLLVRLE